MELSVDHIWLEDEGLSAGNRHIQDNILDGIQIQQKHQSLVIRTSLYSADVAWQSKDIFEGVVVEKLRSDQIASCIFVGQSQWPNSTKSCQQIRHNQHQQPQNVIGQTTQSFRVDVLDLQGHKGEGAG